MFCILKFRVAASPAALPRTAAVVLVGLCCHVYLLRPALAQAPWQQCSVCNARCIHIGQPPSCTLTTGLGCLSIFAPPPLLHYMW